MTQLFRAEAPLAVPGTMAGGRATNPIRRGRPRRPLSACFARATAVLAIAGLAGCADTLTDPAQQPSPAPLTAVSGSDVVGEYSIPVPPNSLLVGATVPWTFTGIMVPRTGKYRIRVQGIVTVTQHPSFPGPCPQSVFTDYLGDWGPMGRPEMGNTALRVAFYKQAATDWGWTWNAVDAATIETEQELEAFTPIWVARQGLGVQVFCTGLSEPIPMFAFSGSQILTVTEVAEPELECKGANGENPIERGKTVRCTITPDKPYRVVSRRAAGEGFTNPETPGTSHAADTEYVWEGPAVADTRVSMVLELTNDDGSTERKTYEDEFQIQARDWPKLQLNAPSVTVGLRGTMQPYPPSDGRGELGNAQTELDEAAIAAHPLALPRSGPNAGLLYVRDPWPAFNFSIYLHPALYDNPATPGQPWQVWHADQNGVGSGTCTQAVFGILEPAVRRHEGATQASNSHFGIARAFFQTSDVEQDLEKIYRKTTDPSVVMQAGVDRLREVMRTTLTPQQEAFDNTDTPALIASLGCTLDHRRNDP